MKVRAFLVMAAALMLEGCGPSGGHEHLPIRNRQIVYGWLVKDRSGVSDGILTAVKGQNKLPRYKEGPIRIVFSDALKKPVMDHSECFFSDARSGKIMLDLHILTDPEDDKPGGMTAINVFSSKGGKNCGSKLERTFAT